MGIMDAVLGNASETSPEAAQEKFAKLLLPGEQIEQAYILIRDYFLFTDKRLILVDVQGITGSKIEYHSIPYRSITHFAIESSGTFDLDAEMKIYISGGSGMPIQKRFNKKLDIYEVQRVLATHILR
jgi:hypothetical protein